jgi:hypothetical protein
VIQVPQEVVGALVVVDAAVVVGAVVVVGAEVTGVVEVSLAQFKYPKPDWQPAPQKEESVPHHPH